MPSSVVEEGAMETLIPNRFLAFTFPSNSLFSEPLRVAVLDSPLPPPSTSPPLVAAMRVPLHRESDWIFSTEAGHLELLLCVPQLSRLILFGDLPHPLPPLRYSRPLHHFNHDPQFELQLKPLLAALSFPSSCEPNIPFVSYQDDVLRSVIVELCAGPIVGDMMVEDVELEGGGFRRRLRFKRSPHLIQTEMRILSDSSSPRRSRLDTASLVHPYLAPMAASLALISHQIDRKAAMPRALCLGVGGGALPSFLVSNLGFQVVGVEEDEAVLRVAKSFFALQDGEPSRLVAGDGIDFLKKHVACDDGGYDAVFVDMDSRDAGSGAGAPPLEFAEVQVLMAAKRAMGGHGVLVVNVMPPAGKFYEKLLVSMKMVYCRGYQAKADNDDNMVVIGDAAVEMVGDGEKETPFLKLLKRAIGSNYISSIEKIWEEKLK